MTFAAHWTGEWITAPASTTTDGRDLLVEAVAGSDAWVTTSYGFVHDDPHALVRPFDEGDALEVVFTVDYDQQFDQAGLYVEAGPAEWIKAGVEFCDGSPQLGAVVTRGASDWSVSPRPDLAGERVRIRASWSGDAVTLRAGVDADSSLH